MTVTGTNINTTQVANVLQVSSRDVGYLCGNEHERTNMWAKYKPVHIYQEPFPDRSGEWWKGTAGNCGILPKLVSTLKDVVANIDGKNNGWVYDPPKGGANSPFRIADFGKYNSEAKCQVHGFTVPALVTYNGILNAQCSFTVETADRDWVSFSDIDYQQLNDCYFGVMLLKGGSVMRRATASTTISQGGYQASFSTQGLTKGEYTACAFLSNQKYVYTDPDKQANYFTIPNTSIVNVKIADQIEFGGIAEYIYQDGVKTGIRYDTMFTLNAGTDMTLTNNYITLRFQENGVNDPLEAGESRKQVSDGTVHKDGTVDYVGIETGHGQVITPWNGIFLIPSNLRDKKFRVDYSFQTGKYTTSVLPAEQVEPD